MVYWYDSPVRSTGNKAYYRGWESVHQLVKFLDKRIMFNVIFH